MVYLPKFTDYKSENVVNSNHNYQPHCYFFVLFALNVHRGISTPYGIYVSGHFAYLKKHGIDDSATSVLLVNCMAIAEVALIDGANLTANGQL